MSFIWIDGLLAMYMYKWVSIPKLLDHLWTYRTMAVGAVIPNRKELPS
jgi:hypothetical protein